MKKLLLLLLLPFTLLSQNSYVIVEAQYDSWGPQESQFYITDNSGDTVLHHIPTVPGEYYLDTLWVNAGSYTAVLLDSYGKHIHCPHQGFYISNGTYLYNHHK